MRDGQVESEELICATLESTGQVQSSGGGHTCSVIGMRSEANRRTHPGTTIHGDFMVTL